MQTRDAKEQQCSTSTATSKGKKMQHKSNQPAIDESDAMCLSSSTARQIKCTEKRLPPKMRLPSAESKNIEPAIQKKLNVFPSQLNKRKWYDSNEDYSMLQPLTPREPFQNSNADQLLNCPTSTVPLKQKKLQRDGNRGINSDEFQAVGHSMSSQQHNPQQLNARYQAYGSRTSEESENDDLTSCDARSNNEDPSSEGDSVSFSESSSDTEMEGNNTTPAGRQQRRYAGRIAGTVRETDLHTEILRLLHNIRLTQEEHTAKLQIILSKISSSKRESCEEFDEEFLEEPFEDLLDFLDFDKGLSSNAAKEKLKYYFRKFGGRHTKEKTIVILQRLMRDDVAVHFSWHGLKGKLKFSDLNCCGVLQKALCTTNMPDAPTFNDVELVVKDWLRRAKERLAKVQK